MTYVKAMLMTWAVALLLSAGASAQTETPPEAPDAAEIPAPSEEAEATDTVAGATLYQRIGGYDTIAEVVDEFFQRMSEDEQLQRFFVGLSESSMRQFRQLTVDFICEETGGPCFYTGRSMSDVHEGTGITAADWERAAELLGNTLDARGIRGELRDEVGSFIAGLRDDIVQEP